MFVPIIMPYGGSSEPSKCPACGKEEETVEVCVHCGHEYKYEPWSLKKKILVNVALVVGIWLSITLIWWFADMSSVWRGPAPTFVDMVVKQIKFFGSIRLW